MDRLDELLADSALRVTATSELNRVTNRITARKPRLGIVAGLVALSLGTGTAAMAASGAWDDLVRQQLGGAADHLWEMDITGVDGTFHCFGGIVVMPDPSRSDYVEADYLAMKNFIQDHDWSELEPNPLLLHDGQRATADALAITADRNMTRIAIDAGMPVTSVSTRGTAQCETK